MKKVILSVTSDLSTDQRVNRTAVCFQKLGYEVVLVGRKKPDSPALESRSYRTVRFNLLFHKGFSFYAFYNIRLFFFLLTNKADILVANDLDTLLPNFLVSKFFASRLIYDTHEYFTGVPELVDRPGVQAVWKMIERYIFPKLKTVITVSNSIAVLYRKEYKTGVQVVRNIPLLVETKSTRSKQDFGIPEGKKIILYQGAGINVDRGVEEAIAAMQYVEDAILLIVGGGDIVEELKIAAKEFNIQDKIIFTGKFPPSELRSVTAMADIGLSLDKDTNINYRFSLPNKLFDYIHAGVPVLASPLKEVNHIIKEFRVGITIGSHDPSEIASKINFMLHSSEMETWKENCLKARTILCWQNEQQVLINAVNSIA